jgi:exopolyphosphatase/pppGpp-phosphohydrolase
MKFAAIDIGSNAVRLLLAKVFENPEGPLIKKESLVRKEREQSNHLQKTDLDI